MQKKLKINNEGFWRIKQVSELTHISSKKIKRIEKYRIVKPRRASNKNEDRLYSTDSVKRIQWANKLLLAGVTAQTVRVLIEYFTSGRIKSYKWYK